MAASQDPAAPPCTRRNSNRRSAACACARWKSPLAGGGRLRSSLTGFENWACACAGCGGRCTASCCLLSCPHVRRHRPLMAGLDTRCRPRSEGQRAVPFKGWHAWSLCVEKTPVMGLSTARYPAKPVLGTLQPGLDTRAWIRCVQAVVACAYRYGATVRCIGSQAA
jgi:hypothetical protein